MVGTVLLFSYFNSPLIDKNLTEVQSKMLFNQGKFDSFQKVHSKKGATETKLTISAQIKYLPRNA